jgi:transcriptional regulator with XRE-family HTH domain
MTNLRHLLAFNMKGNRQKLGLSQAKLAEKAGLSTQYVAMIELTRKFPSPEILGQIAAALEIDTPELFSMQPSVERATIKLHKTILAEIEQAVGETVNIAVRAAVSRLVADHLNNIEHREQNNSEKTNPEPLCFKTEIPC